ncbi:MAG: hypothetical protein ABIF12_03520 [bacterium]
MRKNKILLLSLLVSLFSLAFSLKSEGNKIGLKVLMNAEAFGFGPTAAVAEFFPYLRDKIKTLDFAGTGHTLDLQRKLSYDNIYNLDDEKLEDIALNYDVFITACDFAAANKVKKLGLTVIVYDPIVWYWHGWFWENIVQPGINSADFYIAQNFIGVESRLEREVNLFPEKKVIIPAILPENKYLNDKKLLNNNLLVNLGGLSNPFLDNKDIINFARVIFTSIKENLKNSFDTITYATSKVFVDATKDICEAKTFLPNEMQELLNSSKVAIKTSGLGNIYEASNMKKFVIWLPPANDSQGQQVKLLERNDMLDFAIDWHDLFDDIKPIDYFDEQPLVIEQIGNCMRRLVDDVKAQTEFGSLLFKKIEKADYLQKQGIEPRISNLVGKFGVNGAKIAAEEIIKYLEALED